MVIHTMAYWLIKTEPGTWSWQDQCAAPNQRTLWDGVKNHLANKHLKAMRVGDKCFFYHSVNEKCIVGIVEITNTWTPDSKAGTPWGHPEMGEPEPLQRHVSLAEIKNIPALSEMILVKNSRLSVQPVSATEWNLILKLSQQPA